MARRGYRGALFAVLLLYSYSSLPRFVQLHGDSWANPAMILIHLAMLITAASWMLEGVEVI